jgi:hypothetical protein
METKLEEKALNIDKEIQTILDRNFTRGDNAKAQQELKELITELEKEKDEKIDLLFKLAWSLYNGPEYRKDLTFEQQKAILSNVAISCTSEDAGIV